MAAENKRYLDMLNLHSAEEAYRQVRELASSLSSDQHLIRSCIFDLHAAVEIEFKKGLLPHIQRTTFLDGRRAA